MKHMYFLFALLCTLFLVACGDDETKVPSQQSWPTMDFYEIRQAAGNGQMEFSCNFFMLHVRGVYTADDGKKHVYLQDGPQGVGTCFLAVFDNTDLQVGDALSCAASFRIGFVHGAPCMTDIKLYDLWVEHQSDFPASTISLESLLSDMKAYPATCGYCYLPVKLEMIKVYGETVPGSVREGAVIQNSQDNQIKIYDASGNTLLPDGRMGDLVGFPMMCNGTPTLFVYSSDMFTAVPMKKYKTYSLYYRINSNYQRVYSGDFEHTREQYQNFTWDGHISFIDIEDGSGRAYEWDYEANTYNTRNYCVPGESVSYSDYNFEISNAIPSLGNMKGYMLMLTGSGGITLRFRSNNLCTDMLYDMGSSHTYLVMDLYGSSTNTSAGDLIWFLDDAPYELTEPVRKDDNGKYESTYCSHYTEPGGGGGGTTTDPVWGKVTGKIKAIGPGVYYSDFAYYADGKSTTVDYVYYPSSGKYYVYGGAFDSHPESNGGKGLRYDAQKGYNSIPIHYGSYYDSYYKVRYDWELRLQVTIP